jgi:DEAD/DEAH box helicase domain-containing protein
LQVLGQHIACAAYEHPICLQYDENHFGSTLDSVVTTLKDKGFLVNNPSGPFSSTMWNYIGPDVRSLFILSYIKKLLFLLRQCSVVFGFLQKNPSQTISIRAIEHDKYKVIDKLNNRLLEEIEESKAFFQVICFNCSKST